MLREKCQALYSRMQFRIRHKGKLLSYLKDKLYEPYKLDNGCFDEELKTRESDKVNSISVYLSKRTVKEY